MYSKEIDATLSLGYLGYLTKDDGVTKIDSNTGDNDRIFMVCAMSNSEFKKVAFDLGKPTCFDWFIPKPESKMICGKTLYESLPSSIYPIWLVSDGEDEHVYIFHQFKELTYMLGRMYDDHALTKVCKQRYKKIKT